MASPGCRSGSAARSGSFSSLSASYSLSGTNGFCCVMTSTDTHSRSSATMPPVLRYAALFVVAGIVLIPLIATVLGGFKSLGDLRVHPFGLPAEWEWGNYWGILAGGRYWQ